MESDKVELVIKEVKRKQIAFLIMPLKSGSYFVAVPYLHALHAGAYPLDHRDPFDRMLAAQSTLEAAPLISRDPAFGFFGTEVVW